MFSSIQFNAKKPRMEHSKVRHSLCGVTSIAPRNRITNCQINPSGPIPNNARRSSLPIYVFLRSKPCLLLANLPVIGESQEIRQRLRDGITRNFYYLWEDHERVSLVGSTRETDARRWIAPVYTPKNFRGHGYASALVAAVSQQFVNLGKKCILFTDLANSTSNSIYQKVGYRPLADFKHIEFVRS